MLADELPGFLTAPPEAFSAAMNARLQPLTQLTSLCISIHAQQLGLPALARLSGLQLLCLDDGRPPSLPPGQWIAGLRELGAGWHCLRGSVDALASAAQLERLVVLERSAPESVRADRAFFAWAAQHPPLRSLQFHLAGPMRAGLRTALQQLQKRRPELEVAHASLADGGGVDACPFATSFDLPPFF